MLDNQIQTFGLGIYLSPRSSRPSKIPSEKGNRIMIIDCHAHLVPQSWFHPKSPKSIFDLDALFKQQDEAGVDITVFGNNWIRSPDGYDPLKVVQEFNEHAAELTAKHPKRLLGLACVALMVTGIVGLKLTSNYCYESMIDDRLTATPR
jgi:hypothetical protein